MGVGASVCGECCCVKGVQSQRWTADHGVKMMRWLPRKPLTPKRLLCHVGKGWIDSLCLGMWGRGVLPGERSVVGYRYGRDGLRGY